MTIKDLADRLKKEVPITSEYFGLLKSKGKNMYSCPLCGSGTGKHHTGAFQYNDFESKCPNTFRCHACGKGGTVITLYCLMNGLDPDDKDQRVKAIKEMGEIFLHIPQTDQQYNSSFTANTSPKAIKASEQTPASAPSVPPVVKNPEPEPPKNTEDFGKYYKTAAACLFSPEGQAGLEYLSEVRGIHIPPDKNNFRIGFDPKSDPSRKGYPTPRIIIPFDDHVYVARRTDGVNDNYKAILPVNTTAVLFNGAALTDNKDMVVFLCEGAFDALSIIYEADVSATALSTNSTANVDNLVVKYIETHHADLAKYFVLCFDNDKAGIEARNKVVTVCEKHGIGYSVAPPSFYQGCKDANESLLKNREGFIAECNKLMIEAYNYIDPGRVAMLQDALKQDLVDFKNSACPSSIPAINKVIGGAYYRGIYSLAGGPSMGKTSLSVQEAAEIAKTGRKVFYFELEMPATDVLGKCIVRDYSKDDAIKAGGVNIDENGNSNFLTFTDFRLSSDANDITDKYYAGNPVLANKLSFICGIRDIDEIFAVIDKYMLFHKGEKPPVVFIDYLGLVEARRDNGEQRKLLEGAEAMSYILQKLIVYKKKHNLIIIFVSDTSRENYMLPVYLGINKNYGQIDYACDCIMGLTLFEVNADLLGSRQAEKRAKFNDLMNQPIRDVELTIVKNRNFKFSGKARLNYIPAGEYFYSKPEEEIQAKDIKCAFDIIPNANIMGRNEEKAQQNQTAAPTAQPATTALDSLVPSNAVVNSGFDRRSVGRRSKNPRVKSEESDPQEELAPMPLFGDDPQIVKLPDEGKKQTRKNHKKKYGMSEDDLANLVAKLTANDLQPTTPQTTDAEPEDIPV